MDTKAGPPELQVLGALTLLWLGSMALTYLLWQVALPPTWGQVHPKDVPGSWRHGSSPAWEHLEADAGQQRDSCRLVLVESIPQDLPSAAGSPFAQPLGQAWLQLLDTAQESVHVASYYWSLTGPDIGVNDSSSQLGEALLQKLQQLLGRNISLAVATSSPTLARNSTDLQVLASQGAQVRQVPMGRLTGGVLHSKFWVVDGRHIYMGSANMDWRSLTQVKELGAVIYNCSHLAQDLEKTFQTYWVLGAPEAVLPKTWPQNFSSDFNRFQPFRGLFDGVPTTAYFSVRQIERKPIRTTCSPLTGQTHRESTGLALQTPAASAGSSGSQHSGWGCGPGVSSRLASAGSGLCLEAGLAPGGRPGSTSLENRLPGRWWEVLGPWESPDCWAAPRGLAGHWRGRGTPLALQGRKGRLRGGQILLHQPTGVGVDSPPASTGTSLQQRLHQNKGSFPRCGGGTLKGVEKLPCGRELFLGGQSSLEPRVGQLLPLSRPGLRASPQGPC
ncbi:5'-3' exonuclease PLD4 isoform X3 [Saimiri boliviensis]|uniref:5'-3' exonuclease PLD4 isoform X3 n=1 Tax=Saimiri boliviensis TaxID=27679 RepID=UPI003D7708FE